METASGPHYSECEHGVVAPAHASRELNGRISPLVLILFGALMAGRLTLDSWGISAKGIELRIPIIAALVVCYILWLGAAKSDLVRRWSTAMKLVTVHFAVLMISALWADENARSFVPIFDLVVLVVFVCVATSASSFDPQGAATQLILMLYVTGVVYAVVGLAATGVGNGRLSALGGGPNVYVRVVLLGLLAAVALAVQRRSVAFLVPAPVLLYAALLSGSRGGFVSAIVAALLALLYYARRVKNRYVITGAALMVIGLYALSRSGSDDQLSPVFRRYSSVERITDSDRLKLVDKAMDIFRQHPFAGAGLDSFAATYAPGQRGAYSHNYITSILADTGLVGILALAVGLLAAFIAAFQRLRTATAAQAGLLFGAVFILAACNFSGDYYDSRLAWVFLAVGITPAAISRRTEGRPMSFPPGGPRRRSVTLR